MKNILFNKQQSVLILLIPIVLFWLLLLAWGYPLPDGDDLAFTGTPVNLINGGAYVNPWIDNWHERVSDRFYIQPPFHQFLLTGWLLVSGVSTQSFLAFQCFWYIVASIFLALLLRKYHVSTLLIWLIIILYAVAMAELGFRSEAVGMAFGTTGLYLLSYDTRWHSWGGFTCLGISILSYITIFIYLIPLTAFMIGDRLFKLPISQRWQYLRDRVFCLLSAIAFVSFLFLLSINFEVTHFFGDLMWHTQIRSQPLLNNLQAIQQKVTYGYGEAIYGLLYGLYFSIVILILYRYQKQTKPLLFFTLALTVSFLVNAALYATSIYQGIFHFVMCLGIIILLLKIQLSRILKKILWGLTFIVLLMHFSFDFIVTINYLSSPKISYPQIKNYVQKYPELTYIVDEYAARFVFDYQLPRHTISWGFADEAPNFWLVSPEQIPENTVMIASLFRANYLESIREVPEIPDWSRLKLWRYQVNSIPRYPQKVIIFPKTVK